MTSANKCLLMFITLPSGLGKIFGIVFWAWKIFRLYSTFSRVYSHYIYCCHKKYPMYEYWIYADRRLILDIRLPQGKLEKIRKYYALLFGVFLGQCNATNFFASRLFASSLFTSNSFMSKQSRVTSLEQLSLAEFSGE